jgi:hypothetical protein
LGLNISRAGFGYFLNNTVKRRNNVTLKGYTISKLEVSNLKTRYKRRKKDSKKIKAIDLETNEETIYSSFTLAAQALGVKSSSLFGYFSKKCTNPLKKRYILSLVEKTC